MNLRKHNGLKYILIITSVLFLNTACAIDNPDAPDLINDFKKLEAPYLISIQNPDNSSREYLIAYDNYHTFLDKELNKSYQILSKKLPSERTEELKISQRNWVKFRDAEFKLIQNNWTRQSFGSSSGISRGEYKASIIKSRVLQLISYTINY